MFDEGSQFGPRRRLVDDLLPAIIIHLRELAQLVEYGASLGFAQLREFLDDFGCAHGKIIASVGNLSGESLSQTLSDEKRESARQKEEGSALSAQVRRQKEERAGERMKHEG